MMGKYHFKSNQGPILTTKKTRRAQAGDTIRINQGYIMKDKEVIGQVVEIYHRFYIVKTKHYITTATDEEILDIKRG